MMMPAVNDTYVATLAVAFDAGAKQVASVMASHVGAIYEHGTKEGKRIEVVSKMSEHLRSAFAEWERGNHQAALRQLDWALARGLEQ